MPQGTAIFYNSFISTLPPGDPKGAAWVKRMKFWTAVHELLQVSCHGCPLEGELSTVGTAAASHPTG